MTRLERSIRFLGTGGGGENLRNNSQNSGGILIRFGKHFMHVDPGEGALLARQKLLLEPANLNTLIVTHVHPDHAEDAGKIIDYVANQQGKLPLLIASESVINGYGGGNAAVSKEQLGKVARIEIVPRLEIAQAGSRIDIPASDGIIVLTPIPTQHSDSTCFGFVLEMDGKKVGYTSDTEYFSELPAYYGKCDILIANNMRPDAGGGLKGHLYTDTTARLLKESGVQTAIITHFGVTMEKAGPGEVAKKIQERTGVIVTAASEGMLVEF